MSPVCKMPGTIYIVDDDDMVRVAMARFLKSFGYQTREFAAGSELLDELPLQGLRCLVLDVFMPQLDGLQLQEALRQRGDDTPIVFLTGHHNIKTGLRALENGAVEFLPKAAPRDLVLEAIQRALQCCQDRTDQGLDSTGSP